MVGREKERSFDIGGEREPEQRHSDSHSKRHNENSCH